MHDLGMKTMIQVSKKKSLGKDLIAKAIKDSTEVGIVVPSILRKNLEAAGFKIKEKQLKVLTQVDTYTKKGELVLSGTSDTAADALLFSVYAYMRGKSGGKVSKSK